MPAQFRFDRAFPFGVSPDELWATLSRTEQFPAWWSWLREFDSDGLRAGATARCVIQAPLPYRLALDVRIERVDAPVLVETVIGGDLEGPARLEIEPSGDGCTARLTWSLAVRDPWLRRLAVLGRPVMTWAHDRVVDTGVRQFERLALDGR